MKLKILFENINSRFGSLPFAQRWVSNMINNVDISLKKLSFFGIIKHYPQLVEQTRSLVAQKEHTLIVQKGDSEVITEI